MKNDLTENLDKLHTTPLGIDRIRRNCFLDCEDVVEWCRAHISEPQAAAARYGKNWYVTSGEYVFTINAHSFTVITAHIRE